MFRVRNPGSHALNDFGPLHRTRAPAVAQSPQAIAETTHIVFRQSPVAARKKDQAKKWGRLGGIQQDGFSRVKAQPPALEIFGDALPPHLELFPLVVKQREVVHVAHIPLGPQHFLAEVVQAVQIQIGEELAGQVADRQAAPALEGGEQMVARVVGRFTASCELEPSMMRSASHSVRSQAIRRRRSALRISWSMAGK